VVWIGELTAFSTMVLEGYIAAPPTMGSFMSICAVALNVVTAKAAAARDARNVFFMVFPFKMAKSLDLFRALTIIYAMTRGLDWWFLWDVSKKCCGATDE
jgi:hypothetical protein